MNLSFKEAATYFFKDKTWRYKIPVLAVLIYISSLPDTLPYFIDTPYLITVAGWICLIFTVGYLALIAHNLLNKKEAILPDFNLKRLGIISFKAFCVLLLAFIPVFCTLYVNAPLKMINIGKIVIMVSMPALLILVAITAFCVNFRFRDFFNYFRVLIILMHSNEIFFLFAIMLVHIVTPIFIFKADISLKILSLEILGAFLAFAIVLNFIPALFKKQVKFTQDFLIFALYVTIPIIFVVGFIELLFNHQPIALVLGLITSLIATYMLLIWQYLICQAYMVGLNKSKESGLYP